MREADSAQDYMNQPDSPVMQRSKQMRGKKEKKNLQAKGIWTVCEHIYIQCGTIHVSHT